MARQTATNHERKTAGALAPGGCFCISAVKECPFTAIKRARDNDCGYAAVVALAQMRVAQTVL